MKVAVYAIMKNEAENAIDWIDHCEGADVLCVLDTGSEDGTVDVLRETYGRVWDGGPNRLITASGAIRPFRFDVAHNAALALVPPDVDVCVALAADERLSRGWRKVLEDKWDSLTSMGREQKMKFTYPYEFAPDLTFNHDRIHTRHGWCWKYPFHEGLYPYGKGQEFKHHLPDLKITQVQNKAVDRMSRDLELAEIAIAEYPNDARMNFYVGRQFMYAGQYRKALTYLERHAPLQRQLGWEHPTESQWCHESIAWCWRMINAGHG